jgi:short-subunit dehydrogenase
VIVTVRSKKDLEELEQQIKKENLKMFVILLEITNEKEVIESVPIVQEYLKKNNLEFVSLVNNAGKFNFIFIKNFVLLLKFF